MKPNPSCNLKTKTSVLASANHEQLKNGSVFQTIDLFSLPWSPSMGKNQFNYKPSAPIFNHKHHWAGFIRHVQVHLLLYLYFIPNKEWSTYHQETRKSYSWQSTCCHLKDNIHISSNSHASKNLSIIKPKHQLHRWSGPCHQKLPKQLQNIVDISLSYWFPKMTGRDQFSYKSTCTSVPTTCIPD